MSRGGWWQRRSGGAEQLLRKRDFGFFLHRTKPSRRSRSRREGCTASISGSITNVLGVAWVELVCYILSKCRKRRWAIGTTYPRSTNELQDRSFNNNQDLFCYSFSMKQTDRHWPGVRQDCRLRSASFSRPAVNFMTFRKLRAVVWRGCAPTLEKSGILATLSLEAKGSFMLAYSRSTFSN